jgi:ABC-type polar amino acid transport system ATPase subunit
MELLERVRIPEQAHKYLIADGEIVETGTPEHFFTAPTEERTKRFLSQIL